MHNLLNIKGCLFDPAFPGRDLRQDYFDVLKLTNLLTVHDSAKKLH